ncbi:ribulose-phosphate 3-epimerase [Paenibacillus thalictri]|uniref:Ribulose-phosphate 3-epimerase n=1 Tax=Paenibacillus thalictri TaxID=2527873 RepID=A0A4Q9DXM3_9BACL|nr:ribulose-phosphate 3-epimerase [Paenibacillus thalictri]TBL79991.1 ribulose-phosphate 3-epimerase [Paenibacillus thalictri]
MPYIGPSLMCADLGRLSESVQVLDQGGVDYFHFDIMDGRFVPNFSMGSDMLKSLRCCSSKPFDVHLMVEEPERYIDVFASAGADMISIHAESRVHLQRALQAIRERNLKAGIALNPSTPLCHLDYVMDTLDYVCVMTVNPGFAGQKFIPSTLQKIADLKAKIDASGLDISIQVDGNISFETIPLVVGKGASMLVCGTSSLFLPEMNLELAAASLKKYCDDQLI